MALLALGKFLQNQLPRLGHGIDKSTGSVLTWIGKRFPANTKLNHYFHAFANFSKGGAARDFVRRGVSKEAARKGNHHARGLLTKAADPNKSWGLKGAVEKVAKAPKWSEMSKALRGLTKEKANTRVGQAIQGSVDKLRKASENVESRALAAVVPLPRSIV